MLSSNAGVFPGVSNGKHGLDRTLMSFGLPPPKVPFLSVALSEDCGILGLSVSIDGAPGSVSESIMAVLFCFDGDLLNQPSGPLSPFPLLLCSWLQSVLSLLIFILCSFFPL